MKKLIIVLFSLLLINGVTFSQSCLPGDNNFYSQVQIDNFKFYNPGCSQIEGNVFIYNDYITNLDSLSVLTSVWGNLKIMWANSLKDLSGLENIDSIGGDLNIGVLPSRRGSGNDSLINLDALNNLTFVGGDIYIGFNNSLISIEGLDNLTFLGGGVTIAGNDSLLSLDGLNNFTALEYLNINGNTSLLSLEGLDNLTSVGELGIWGNDSLHNLNGLENLTTISGNLTVGAVGHNFHGGTYCMGNQSLKTLDGLGNLSVVSGDLSILCNDSLASLSALENLVQVEGNIDIGFYIPGNSFGNPQLVSLSGLDNIDPNSIDSLFIADNNSLADCAVQSICDYLKAPNGEVIIENNSNGCNSLEQVDSACVYVTFNENPFELRGNIYPNPFCCSITIAFALNQAETVRITFYNQFGKQVDVIEESQQKGLNKIVWTPYKLPNGIYYFKLKAGDQIASGKVVLLM